MRKGKKLRNNCNTVQTEEERGGDDGMGPSQAS